MKRFLPALFMLLALNACQKEGSQAYLAVGNEPGWLMVITDQGLELATGYGEKKFTAPPAKPEKISGGRTYRFQTADGTVDVRIVYTACQDVMSGRNFPNQVTVQVDGSTLTGCGGPAPKAEPLPAEPSPAPPENPTGAAGAAGGSMPSLFGHIWVLDAMDGQPVASEARFDLVFKEDRMAGKSGCNRYSATYEFQEETLKVTSPMIGTKMACPPPVMELENRFTATLGAGGRIVRNPDGGLEIRTADGRSLAFRPEPEQDAPGGTE
ncbi:MAG: META domain-containing protein [Pseudomonadota bacterium]|nr:META domain-containing protein [Pseudomonadota bacterium]